MMKLVQSREFILKNNKSGFVLLEAIMALIIFTLIQATFTEIVEVQGKFNQNLTQQYDDDWAIYSIKMERLAQSSTIEKVNQHSLVLRDADNQLIKFEHYQNNNSQMIRRLKNGRGHQPVLMAVKSFNVSQLNKQAVQLNVTMTNGEDHSQVLYFPIREGATNIESKRKIKAAT